MSVDGAEAIARKLQKLATEGADKAAISGSRAAAKEFEKGIKDAIPGQYRSARKAIGRRVRKVRGEVVAKVGAGVGKRSATTKARKKSGGVGLSKNNIHWAILGVKARQTKQGKNRGKHGAFLAGIVQQGASNAEVRAGVAMRDAVQKELDKAAK